MLMMIHMRRPTGHPHVVYTLRPHTAARVLISIEDSRTEDTTRAQNIVSTIPLVFQLYGGERQWIVL